MSNKRVLIVDDDQTMLRMLEYGLKKLGSEYQVFTAVNTLDAMKMLEKQPFDLVVADYMMPGLTGIDLARAVRRISPSTPIVLMTAYGSQRLRDTIGHLGIEGYLDKPFSLEKVRRVVKYAVDMSHQPKDLPRVDDSILEQSIRRHLETLQTNANARCVLLLNSDGCPVQVVGQADDLEISSVGKFLAANFLATVQLANMLGRQSIFKSSYHEGNDYNIYAYDVNGKFLLAVVYDTKHRPGVVWFYTKQMAAILAKLLDQPA